MRRLHGHTRSRNRQGCGKRRILPTWIAFTDQNNPNWNEQDSSVWPIQNFHWRDLTLRKSRDTTTVRPIDFKVHYEIVPVALADASQKELPPSSTAPAKDAYGQPSYLGPKHPLVAIGNPIKTNAINVTHTYGKNVKATFTNGILSTQNLARQLESVKKGPSKNAIKDANSDKPAERAKAADQKENHLLKTLKDEIQRPDSKIREFLMGDVYKFVTELVDRARKERGQVYLALYELHDKQLIKLLVDAMKSKLVHIILTTAGKKGDKKPPAKKGSIKMPPPAIWWPGGPGSQVAMVRAAAVRIPFGDLRPELLTAGHAIIHDKIIAIDPLDKKNCTVITGSHNLGYKASYCNDENFLIIEGNRDLAVSYAVHVLDLYEHYLMRARLEEKIRQDIKDGKLTSYKEAAAHVVPHGLLSLTDSWQKGKLESKRPSSMTYFLANAQP